jgi:hypothetical protein
MFWMAIRKKTIRMLHLSRLKTRLNDCPGNHFSRWCTLAGYSEHNSYHSEHYTDVLNDLF